MHLFAKLGSKHIHLTQVLVEECSVPSEGQGIIEGYEYSCPSVTFPDSVSTSHPNFHVSPISKELANLLRDHTAPSYIVPQNSQVRFYATEGPAAERIGIVGQYQRPRNRKTGDMQT